MDCKLIQTRIGLFRQKDAIAEKEAREPPPAAPSVEQYTPLVIYLYLVVFTQVT